MGPNPPPAGANWTLNWKQTGTNAAMAAMRKILLTNMYHTHFKNAGIAAALRHTIGMEAVPSHVNDYINSLQNQQQRDQTAGAKPPGPAHAAPRTLDDLLGHGAPTPGGGSPMPPTAPQGRTDVRAQHRYAWQTLTKQLPPGPPGVQGSPD